MSKRSAEDSGGGSTGDSQPAIKKVHFQPHLIGPISTLEEMDVKVLQFQNKKLAQRIEQRTRNEAELKLRIEQLEKRQMQDDALLTVVNRYWNQLNEDIRVLLQRFDAETSDETENKNESEITTSFLMQLSTWDKEELDEKLANRVHVSTRAVAKIIQVFDRLMQRNQKITHILKGEPVGDDDDGKTNPPNIEETLRQTTIDLMEENRNLQQQNTQLHEKYHTISLKISKYQDSLAGKETEAAEMKNQIDELKYELDKVRCRNDKLENHLAEAIEKMKKLQVYGNDEKRKDTQKCPVTSVATQQLEDLQKELEEHREMATNRLQELEKLQQDHRDRLEEVEKLKMDIRSLPESVIVETTEYKCLQSQYSVLYNEYMQIKNLLEETRTQLQTSKTQHLRQIEFMESNELAEQKRSRNELIKMEDLIEKIQKEYDMLRIEYEQNLAANEQTAPINREMRHLITSLQNHNTQLKGEVNRYKRKYKEVSADNFQLRKELEELNLKLSNSQARNMQENEIKQEANQNVEEPVTNEVSNVVKEESGMSGIKSEPSEHNEGECDKQNAVKSEKTGPDGVKKEGTPGAAGTGNVKTEKEVKEEQKNKEDDLVRELKAQLKKALYEQKEVKLLLDMYKGVSKEQRDKVQLMASEKKIRAELEELRNQMKKMQESKREDRKKLADEEAQRKIKQLTEQLELQKQAANQKQSDGQACAYRPFVGSNEEEALLNEMEVTGLAYEEMQEQNSRLLQQLKEKDDANFKLMSDRIKANQLHKLLKEEQLGLEEQNASLQQELESIHVVLRKLEEKERVLQNAVASMEKDLALRQQAMEMHKRKAFEQAQSAADLKLHLEKYHAQMKEAQQVVAEKTSALEAEAYKNKRLQEELIQFKRKAERMKNIEMTGTTMDQVMMEEIREYKEILTCPSCKIKKIDAVLSKCFHVFCYDCLKTRYETRQRKCPKCNNPFGANDYHRLYLA